MSKSKSKVEKDLNLAVAGIDSQAADGPRDKEQQDEDDGEAAEGAIAQVYVTPEADAALTPEAKAEMTALTQSRVAAARERFERVSRQFLSGGASREELAAAQAEMEAHHAVDA